MFRFGKLLRRLALLEETAAERREASQKAAKDQEGFGPEASPAMRALLEKFGAASDARRRELGIEDESHPLPPGHPSLIDPDSPCRELAHQIADLIAEEEPATIPPEPPQCGLKELDGWPHRNGNHTNGV